MINGIISSSEFLEWFQTLDRTAKDRVVAFIRILKAMDFKQHEVLDIVYKHLGPQKGEQ